MSDFTWIINFASEINESHVPDRWNLNMDENLLEIDNAKYFRQTTFGSFCCSYCKRRWISSKVFILFRMDLNKYHHNGKVTMRIFKQGCQKCIMMQMPKIPSENINRVISNVVNHIQRVFYKKEYVNDNISPNDFGNLVGPHDEENCEACQLNLCERQAMSSQESSSSVLPAVAAGVGITVGIGALALLFLSLNKTKENKRSGP